MSARVRCAGLVAASLVVVLSMRASSQGVDRSKRPGVPAPTPFAFPHVETRTLPNGLRVAIVENHSLPIVAVRVVLPVDSTADPAGKEGLFALTLAMLREGSASRTADQLAAATSELGNDVAPTRFTTIAANFDRSLELMADMLVHPAFPEAALPRRQAVQVSTVQRQLQLPPTIPRRILFATVLGADHPMARAVVASEASIKSITRDDVDRFYRAYVQPQNVTLVVTGDVHAAAVMSAVSRAFGAWEKLGAPFVAVTAPAPTPAATTIYLFDRPGAPQSFVVAGQVGPSRTTPDYTALEMMGAMLGGGSASRLALNLRERHSYMYNGVLTVPVWRPAPDPSVVFGSAAFYTPKTDSAVTQWLSEIRAIRGERAPTTDEMAAARATLTGNLPMQVETVDRVADRVAFLARNGLSFDFDIRVVAAVAKLKPVDIVAVAKRYLDPDHMAIVIAGDRRTIEPALRAANIAPIVIVDENGKRLP